MADKKAPLFLVHVYHQTPVLPPQDGFFFLGMSKKGEKMKITRKIITLAIALLLALASLTSCGALFGTSVTGNEAILVLEAKDGQRTEYKIDLNEVSDKSKGAYSLVLFASEKYDFPVDAGDGPFGAYLNSVGPVTPDAASGEYVALFTSVEKDFQVPTADFPLVGETTYNGVTLKSAGVGITSMSVEDGTIILIKVESWQ
jgi:hypothetical protein